MGFNTSTHKETLEYTVTGQFIIYHLVPGRTPPLDPEWPELFGVFYMVSEEFHRDVCPCRRDGITQLLRIGRRYVNYISSQGYSALLGGGLGTE